MLKSWHPPAVVRDNMGRPNGRSIVAAGSQTERHMASRLPHLPHLHTMGYPVEKQRTVSCQASAQNDTVRIQDIDRHGQSDSDIVSSLVHNREGYRISLGRRLKDQLGVNPLRCAAAPLPQAGRETTANGVSGLQGNGLTGSYRLQAAEFPQAQSGPSLQTVMCPSSPLVPLLP